MLATQNPDEGELGMYDITKIKASPAAKDEALEQA